MIDITKTFAEAESAFTSDRLADARRLVDQVLRAGGDHPAVLHLSALVHKKAGDVQAADAAFRRALRLSPRDPQMLNNHANLLGKLGQKEHAIALYDRALDAAPRFADARLNRGLALHDIGRPERALADFEDVLRHQPDNVRALSAKGAALRELGRLAEAAAAYDRALALAPTRDRVLVGRARVALESGEAGASDRYRMALAARPGDLQLRLGLADALEAEGQSEALVLLESMVADEPGLVEAHERLAEMRQEQGEEDFAASYRRALEARPSDAALNASHWRALSLGGRYREALEAMDLSERHLPPVPATMITRAIFLVEAGEPAAALERLEALGDGPDVVMARARGALRLGRPHEAAAGLHAIAKVQPGNIIAWAHLALAWRLTEDARYDWLCLQPGLHGTIDLGLDDAALRRLGDLLRALHRTRAHPLGQSLRGGTQTRGRLFWRREPEIVALRDAVDEAIGRFVQGLPAADPAHPLLRHRDSRLAVAGSWSVRLAASGFHINHIHPRGVLSSACYIALPTSLGSDHGRDGWLDLGASPTELGLDLGPIASVQPKAGLLALFPSYLFHGTRPFSSGERLTVAFDAVAQ